MRSVSDLVEIKYISIRWKKGEQLTTGKKNISIRENTVERKSANNTLNYTTSNTLNYTPNTLFIIG